MAKIRYNIIIMSSARGVRKADFVYNRNPLRPGSIDAALYECVQDQYKHMSFGVGTYSQLPRYWVSGTVGKGKGVDGTDIIGMYCIVTGAATVIKVVRA